jgi:hypothetical protein
MTLATRGAAAAFFLALGEGFARLEVEALFDFDAFFATETLLGSCEDMT